jgi:CO dehydrogenase/acetyl-CoA synthase delta subunit
MRYIKEYKSIDWEDWDIEEYDESWEDIPEGNCSFYEGLIGKKVKIKPTSAYYGFDKVWNPANKIGKIQSFECDDCIFIVFWGVSELNNRVRITNSYHPSDLLIYL